MISLSVLFLVLLPLVEEQDLSDDISTAPNEQNFTSVSGFSHHSELNDLQVFFLYLGKCVELASDRRAGRPFMSHADEEEISAAHSKASQKTCKLTTKPFRHVMSRIKGSSKDNCFLSGLCLYVSYCKQFERA